MAEPEVKVRFDPNAFTLHYIVRLRDSVPPDIDSWLIKYYLFLNSCLRTVVQHS